MSGRRAGKQPHAPRFTTKATIMLAIVGAIALSTALPVRQYVAARHKLSALEQQSAQVDQEVVNLTAEKKRLAGDAEVERLARERLGMVRPGEVAFVAVPTAAPSAAQDLPEQTRADARSWYSRLWGWLTGK